MAHTGGAFAFPGVERVGNATEVGREFVTVTSDEVDTDALCEEDMTLGVRSRRSRSKGVHIWPHRVTCFCLFRECRDDLSTNRKLSFINPSRFFDRLGCIIGKDEYFAMLDGTTITE